MMIMMNMMISLQTLVPENINPLTKKPFGESFMSTGTLDLIGEYASLSKLLSHLQSL